ncbi:peptidoglycan recognition protein family protein [Nocardioides campestrisoli]|uniref:peptidoglycan recognition protein family protein n=1 Tax=Nocardioides campestrisoli TaxID=2736757 RepID=UPI0015E63AAC|nr:N-acetylmuramoyl-L-alanine amidase [Nocardioides campestrisoli]
MSTYLEQHPPRQTQFRRPRRGVPSGVIVVHTAESVMDTVGPDTGAENVAAFIANRSDYGSYHTLVDSDSIVRLVPYDAEAYGDGTGSNTHAIHISFACSAADWPRMSKARRDAFIRNGAAAAAHAARWLEDDRDIRVPARRITRGQSESRVPGFISHGERDPGRRSDPGAAFPWDAFLDQYDELVNPKPKKGPLGPVKKELRQAQREARKADRPGLVERIKQLRLSAIRRNKKK